MRVLFMGTQIWIATGGWRKSGDVPKGVRVDEGIVRRNQESEGVTRR